MMKDTFHMPGWLYIIVKPSTGGEEIMGMINL